MTEDKTGALQLTNPLLYHESEGYSFKYLFKAKEIIMSCQHKEVVENQKILTRKNKAKTFEHVWRIHLDLERLL